MSYETLDRNRRTRTKHRGISFTERSDGRRTYFVTCGARRVRVDGGLNEALAVQADHRLKRVRGERVTPTRVTFGEIAEAWLTSKRVEDSTRDRYQASLNVWLLPRWRDSPIASVTEDDLALMVRDAEAAGRAAWTIKNNLVVASGVFGFAVRRGHTARNPVAHLTRDERPAANGQQRTKAFTREQLATLFAAAEPEDLLLYRLLAGTGLRIGEALGLEWRHVDLTGGVVRVEQQASPDGNVKRTKTSAAVRDVPLDDILAAELRRRRVAARHSRDTDPVFASSSGTVLRVHNLRERSFRPLLKQLGWAKQGYGFHSFRRSYVSALIASGLDVVSVSKYAGHASPTITLDRYAKEFNARERDDSRVREVTAGLWATQA